MAISNFQRVPHFGELWPRNPSTEKSPTHTFDRSWIALANCGKKYTCLFFASNSFSTLKLVDFYGLRVFAPKQPALQWANGRSLPLEKAFSVEIDPIKYWGANRKPMAASSNFRFPPYFYFRFGRKRPSDGIFRCFWPFLCTIAPDNSNQGTVLSGP